MGGSTSKPGSGGGKSDPLGIKGAKNAKQSKLSSVIEIGAVVLAIICAIFILPAFGPLFSAVGTGVGSIFKWAVDGITGDDDTTNSDSEGENETAKEKGAGGASSSVPPAGASSVGTVIQVA